MCLLAWLGAACASPSRVFIEEKLRNQHSVGGVTYTASLTTSLQSETLRVILRVKNDSPESVELRPTYSCDLQIQLRVTERPGAQAAVWDSERSRRGWECVGGMRTILVAAGASQEISTDFPIWDLNRSIRRGSYEVFVTIGGPASPGWLYAGLLSIPIS
jgi:hypothetical protein